MRKKWMLRKEMKVEEERVRLGWSEADCGGSVSGAVESLDSDRGASVKLDGDTQVSYDSFLHFGYIIYILVNREFQNSLE